MTALPLSDPPPLRAAVKWPPLARDILETEHNLHSPEYAQKELSSLTLKISALTLKLKFLSSIKSSPDKCAEISRQLKLLGKRRQILDRYLAQSQKLSHDLDLYCLCYDSNDECLAFVSPATAAHHRNFQRAYADPDHPAFYHSGDDKTGINKNAFNETLRLDLKNLAPEVSKIYLILYSVNHCFDKIQGTTNWSLTNLLDNSTVFSHSLKTDSPHKLYAMAKITREASEWKIDEVDSYIPFATNLKELNKETFTQLIKKHFSHK